MVMQEERDTKTVFITKKKWSVMLNPRDAIRLHNAGVVRKIQTTHIIYTADASVKYLYLLQSGLIKISNINSDGEEIIKYFIKPGSLFGELNLFEAGEDKNEVAIALENSEVCFIPADSINQLMSANHDLRKSIYRMIGLRIKRMEERMLSLMLKNVKERILDFLKEFVTEFGSPVNGGYSASFFLTHEDIAKITTTSRQSVTTTLLYFKKKGIIDYNTRVISVLNFCK